MGQWTGFFIFLFLVTSVYSAAHFYLYFWFARLAEPSQTVRRIVGVVFVFLVVSFPASRILSWRDFNSFTYLLMLISSVWMGLVLYLFILALWSDIAMLLLKIFRLRSRLPGKVSLRTKRYFFTVVLIAVAGIGGISLYEARNIGVSKVVLSLAELPPELDGLTIAHISDFHFGVLNNKAKLEKAVALTNSLNADLIFLTGDMVDESVAHMEDMAGPLRELKGKWGVYATTGNHDYLCRRGPGHRHHARSRDYGLAQRIENSSRRIAGAGYR